MVNQSVTRVLAENLVGLGFLQPVSYIKSIPTHEKKHLLWGKVAHTPLLSPIFLGLGWPWVREYRQFRNNSVNCKYPSLACSLSV